MSPPAGAVARTSTPPPGALPRDALRDAVHATLTGALRLARLTSVDLVLPGVEGLSVVLQAATPEQARAVLSWSVPIPTSDWLTAGAMTVTALEDDEPAARLAVEHAATIIGHLVSSDRRRQQAEALADRAIALAGVDPLTGLGNRRTWVRALVEEQDRAARHGGYTSLFVLDLDRLKEVNDRDGHRAGDALLTRSALLLRSSCRSVDKVCRLGGDEFGVLAPRTGSEGAANLLDRLRRRFDQAQVAVSMGVATAPPGASIDVAWQQADQRMYERKRARA